MQAKVFLHNVLIVLVALLAISLAWFSIDPYYGYAKAAATLVIVAFFLRFARDLGGLNYVLGAVALVFCLVGDVALLFDNGFLAGLSSFLIGHLIFVWLFSRLAQGALSWFAVIFRLCHRRRLLYLYLCGSRNNGPSCRRIRFCYFFNGRMGNQLTQAIGQRGKLAHYARWFLVSDLRRCVVLQPLYKPGPTVASRRTVDVLAFTGSYR